MKGMCFVSAIWRSVGTVPVIQNVTETDGNAYGMICLVNGDFRGTGDASATSAIDNQSILFARNVTATGYRSVIKNLDGAIARPTVVQYCSGKVRSLFTTSEHSLGLPAQETPDGFDSDLSHWESVTTHGATPNDDTDDTAAIQRALDAGKPTVYFPNGKYLIRDTLHVRGSVKHIFGCGSNLCLRGTGFDNAKLPRSMFRFEGRNDVIVEGFNLNMEIPFVPHPGLLFLEHATPRVLTLKCLTMYGQIDAAYRAAECGGISSWRTSAARPTALAVLDAGPKSLGPAVESGGEPHDDRNRGASLWLLGLKTEGWGTVIETTGGGQTELLGGLLYPAWGNPGRTPAFVITDSTAALYVRHPRLQLSQGPKLHDPSASDTRLADQDAGARWESNSNAVVRRLKAVNANHTRNARQAAAHGVVGQTDRSGPCRRRSATTLRFRSGSSRRRRRSDRRLRGGRIATRRCRVSPVTPCPPGGRTESRPRPALRRTGWCSRRDDGPEACR